MRGTGTRAVVWQLPLGNTVMRAMDDTWGHFRDNRVQTLLDDAPRYRVLRGLRERASSACCSAPARTAPRTPPTGAETASRTRRRSSARRAAPLNADDDGGFFRLLSRRYARSPLRLP